MPAPAPPTPPRRAFVVLPLAWAAFILVSTLTPSGDMPVMPHWQLLSFDTAAHAFVFGVLAALLVFSARRQTGGRYCGATPARLSTAWLMTHSRKKCRCVLLAALVFTTPLAAAQDMPRVRRTIETLTAPAMHGRGYVSQGDRKAAAYLRQRFQELGLQPLAPDYTQPFTLDINTFRGL